MELVFHGQGRKNGVIDERRAEIGEHSGAVSLFVLKEEPGDQVVEDGIAQELQPLIASGHPVPVIRRVCEGLDQIGLNH